MSHRVPFFQWLAIATVLVVGLMVGAASHAQESGEVKTPTFDADDKLALTLLSAIDKRWQADCGKLDGYQEFVQFRKQWLTRLETKYPGFTLNGAGTGLALIKK